MFSLVYIHWTRRDMEYINLYKLLLYRHPPIIQLLQYITTGNGSGVSWNEKTTDWSVTLTNWNCHMELIQSQKIVKRNSSGMCYHLFEAVGPDSKYHLSNVLNTQSITELVKAFPYNKQQAFLIGSSIENIQISILNLNYNIIRKSCYLILQSFIVVAY